MDRRGWEISGGAVVALVLFGVAPTPDRSGPADPSPAAATPVASTTPSPTPSATPTAEAGPAVLLPNLRSLDAYDLRIETTPTGRRLRFAASPANVGTGPFVLQPRGRQDCRPRQLSAVQILSVDRNGDGEFRRGEDRRTRRQPAGCMLRHFGHDHWHFDAMAAYSLRRPDVSSTLAARSKVSFYLRDNSRVRDVATTVRREHFGECSATGVQGISPGWADIYGADLDGQWLALPRGADDEVVCLDLTADPRDLVEETDESDNGTSVAVRIDGTSVRCAKRSACV